MVAKSDGVIGTFRVNGVEDTVTAENGTNNGDWFGDIPNRDNFTIGGIKYNIETQFMMGDIAEIIVYDLKVVCCRDCCNRRILIYEIYY